MSGPWIRCYISFKQPLNSHHSHPPHAQLSACMRLRGIIQPSLIRIAWVKFSYYHCIWLLNNILFGVHYSEPSVIETRTFCCVIKLQMNLFQDEKWEETELISFHQNSLFMTCGFRYPNTFGLLVEKQKYIQGKCTAEFSIHTTCYYCSKTLHVVPAVATAVATVYPTVFQNTLYTQKVTLSRWGEGELNREMHAFW